MNSKKIQLIYLIVVILFNSCSNIVIDCDCWFINNKDLDILDKMMKNPDSLKKWFLDGTIHIDTTSWKYKKNSYLNVYPKHIKKCYSNGYNIVFNDCFQYEFPSKHMGYEFHDYIIIQSRLDTSYYNALSFSRDINGVWIFNGFADVYLELNYPKFYTGCRKCGEKKK